MSADTKTQLELVNDALKQLKEMHHYSKNYVEQLTAQWLLFEGELKALKQVEAVEGLMTRQAELHDALGAEIDELEALTMTLQPAPEENPSN
jgi:superfamily II RNA helicase